jgi:hypothetical protein
VEGSPQDWTALNADAGCGWELAAGGAIDKEIVVAKKTVRKSAAKSTRKTARKTTRKTARPAAGKTARKTTAKSTRKTTRKSARRAAPGSRRPAGPVCGVTPNVGPHTFPAVGGEFFVLVSYPTGPDACPYTAKPNVRWIRTNPRISEFDVILAPNPSARMRRGVVVVQGQNNPIRHQVIIQQAGR